MNELMNVEAEISQTVMVACYRRIMPSRRDWYNRIPVNLFRKIEQIHVTSMHMHDV